MSRIYFLVFLPDAAEEGKPTIARKKVAEWLDRQSWCDHWFYQLPNSVFIKSSKGAIQISKEFEATFGDRHHFIVQVSIAGEFYGRLPKEHWNLF